MHMLQGQTERAIKRRGSMGVLPANSLEEEALHAMLCLKE
jgi:hypothetical protein